MKRDQVFNQAKEISAQLYKGEDLSGAEALFKRLFRENGMIYSRVYLKTFLEGMIFASGVPYVENIKTMSLIMALIQKYDTKQTPPSK